jgi:hypothetical protein
MSANWLPDEQWEAATDDSLPAGVVGLNGQFIPVPDLLPLRSIATPREVTQVAGCDCGGIEWHAETCTIWDRPHAEGMAAVDAARERIKAFTAALNDRLHEALGQKP